MAAGDILSVTVDALARLVDVKVEGVAAGGSYVYDSSGSTTELVAALTAKLKLVATSKGHTGAGAATTTPREIYGQKVLRIAGLSTPLETVSGSDLIISFALSAPIYDLDDAAGSGVDVSYTILPGLYTKSGVPNAAASGTAVNNSTLAYYSPRGQWVTINFQRVDADFEVEFDPQYLHGIAGTAAVRFTITGSTTGAILDQYVTSRTKRQRTGSSLYSDAFRLPVPIALCTLGETITCRARVYTSIGDQVFDTNSRGSDLAIQKNSNLTFKYAAKIYAIVDTGAGGGSATSTTLATARLTPFATIQAAMIAGANTIYVKNQSHTFNTPASTPSDLGYWMEVTQDPADLGGTVTLANVVLITFKHHLRFTNITVKLGGNLGLLTSTGKYLWFDRVYHDDNGVTLAANMADDVLGTFYTDCTWSDSYRFKLNPNGGDLVRQSFDGCDFGTASTSYQLSAWHCMVACKGVNISPRSAWPSSTTVGNGWRNNLLFKNCEFSKIGAAGGCEFSNHGEATTDYFFVGLTLEGTNLVGTAVFGVGQGNTEYDIDHGVIAHITAPGGKVNYLYNDGVPGNAVVKYRRGWGTAGIFFGDRNTKHDLFTDPGPPVTANANRIGGWWHDVGTLSSGHRARISTFPPDYAGLGSVVSSADPGFTDDRSGDTGGSDPFHYNANSGLGQGDYSLTAVSPMLACLQANTAHATCDSRGVDILNNGMGATGARQRRIATSYAGAWWPN
jgi:hypothetical protein